MTVPANELFRTGAVVRQKYDHSIVEFTHGLYLLDNLASLGVHATDHGGVNRHFGALELLLFCRERRPRHRATDLSGTVLGDQFRIRGVPVSPHVGFKRSK